MSRDSGTSDRWFVACCYAMVVFFFGLVILTLVLLAKGS